MQDAFEQAAREKQDDSLAYRLEHLVENEKLTQAEADQILDWFLSRSDAAAKLRRALRRGEEAVENRLNRLVERGVISQDEADEVLRWYNAMPQALKDLHAQRFHRSPDSKSRGQVRPSLRFQGQDMDRPAFQDQRSGRDGFARRDGDGPDFRGQRFDREGFGPPQVPGNRWMPDAHGLEQSGRPDYANLP